jgi:thiosulfate/3-mercaptopyruvate sulfurtransferase
MPVPVRERGYPHPELLAETDWLAGRLSDPTVRVVDTRSDRDYAGGHIPGAVRLDGYTLGGLRTGSGMPEPEAFARLAGALGIDEHTSVVVYDAGGPPTAGMVAWAFLYYGHPDTRLLDGGLTKWTAEGLPLSNDAPAHEPRAFAARLAEGVYCSLDQAKASVDDDGVIVWDVRSVGEFEGTTKGWKAPPRLGHLPGAIHLEWAELFDSDNGTLKPAAELTALLGAKGITPQATVVAY